MKLSWNLGSLFFCLHGAGIRLLFDHVFHFMKFRIPLRKIRLILSQDFYNDAGQKWWHHRVGVISASRNSELFNGCVCSCWNTGKLIQRLPRLDTLG